MRPLRRLAFVRRAVAQRVRDPDPLDHEDLLLDVDVALGLGRQPPLARVDPARLQRASKGAGESTGGRGDDVVEGGGVLRVLTWRRSVVLADGPVRAED